MVGFGGVFGWALGGGAWNAAGISENCLFDVDVSLICMLV